MADLLFSNYTELKASVAEALNRTDLIGAIPGFIRLAEAEIDRVLRRTSTRATITVSSASTTLSSGIAELRSVRLVSGSTSQDVVLDVVTPEMLSEHRAGYSATGRPRAAAVVGRNLLLAPAPDQAYSAEVIYFPALVPLSGSNATNVVLTEAPDLYFYGAMKHSAPFLEHDERLPMWSALSDSAIDQLHKRREREEHGANMRPMRLPYVFGARP